MAESLKVTVRVQTSRRSQSVSWTCNGQYGELNLAQEAGSVPNLPLASTASNKQCVTDILNQVIANLI